MNPDGSCHFDTCKFADEFRNKKKLVGAIDYTKKDLPKGQTTLNDKNATKVRHD